MNRERERLFRRSAKRKHHGEREKKLLVCLRMCVNNGIHKIPCLPGTRKRTRSQTESQQHTPLSQILDTVALNSQILIQPTEQPTNSQPNKRTTRSQITSHNHHATQASTQIVTPPIQHINIINRQQLTRYTTTQPLRLQTTQHQHHSADPKGKEDVRYSIYPITFLA